MVKMFHCIALEATYEVKQHRIRAWPHKTINLSIDPLNSTNLLIIVQGWLYSKKTIYYNTAELLKSWTRH